MNDLPTHQRSDPSKTGGASPIGSRLSSLNSQLHHRRAVLMLTLATVAWGLSFPLTKTLLLSQEALAPGSPSWFYAGLTLVFRFGLGALFIGLWRPSELRKITALEWQQGLAIGLFGGLGLLLQSDGLRYTDASTSAFLTQFYCMLLPLIAAVHRRRLPSPIVAISCLGVLAGVGILARLDLHHLRLGRGELETLGASTLFAAQILCLEVPRFQNNYLLRMSWVMFISTALLLAAVTFPLARHTSDLLLPFASRPNLTLSLVLALVCSLFTYLVMNKWQPHIDATRAGLIYCSEPLFTSVFSLFLPALLSKFAAVPYANEHLAANLLLGGGLITGANLLMACSAPAER